VNLRARGVSRQRASARHRPVAADEEHRVDATASESRDCGFEVSSAQAIAAAAEGHTGRRLERVEPRLVDTREIEPFSAHERGQPVGAAMKRSGRCQRSPAAHDRDERYVHDGGRPAALQDEGAHD